MAPQVRQLPQPSSVAEDERTVQQLMLQMARSSHPRLDEAATHAVGAPGKGLRIRLALLVGRFGSQGPEQRQRLLSSAACVELLHIASMVHDDVIDSGAVRRGRPSVNALWGDRLAVLTGDHLIARVGAATAELGIEAGVAQARALTELVRGEVAEVAGEGRVPTVAEHLRVLEGKTATLFVHAVDLAGLVTDVDEELRRALRCFARRFGIAFQLTDDLLDLFPRDLTKPAGVDLRNKVWTLPVLAALASGSGRSGELAELLDEPRPSARAVGEIRRLVVELGGAAVATEAVASYLHLAWLATLDLPPTPPRDELRRLLDQTRLALPQPASA